MIQTPINGELWEEIDNNIFIDKSRTSMVCKDKSCIHIKKVNTYYQNYML